MTRTGIKIAILVLALSTVLALQSDLCSNSRASTITFSARSHHNATGHQIVEVDVSDGHPLGGVQNGTTMNVEAAKTTCGDLETTRFTVEAVRLLDLHEYNKHSTLEVQIPPAYKPVPRLGVYKVHTEKMSWIDAHDACISEGAHLMVVNSQEKADLVAKLCAEVECNICLWIGFHDYFKEKHFVTVTGELLSQSNYTDWRKGEPGGTKESCGCICVSEGLCDDTCNRLRTFICELRI